MIKSDLISGREICQILIEQHIIEVDSDLENKLYHGGISPFLQDKSVPYSFRNTLNG